MNGDQTTSVPVNPRDVRGSLRTETTLRDVLAPLFRQRKLVVFSFSGVLLLTILGVLFRPNQYQAHMQVLVKRERVDPVVTS